MTKEEQATAYRYHTHLEGGPYNGDDLYDAFVAGYEQAIRDRDENLKEAMKQSVMEVMAEIKKPTTGGDGK